MDRRKILLVVAVVVAALGAALVFVYAQDAEDRAAAKVQTQQVLVANKMIMPGESAADAADAGKLLSLPVPEAQVLEGSTNNGDDFADKVALTTIYPGEQLVTQKFGAIEDIEGATQLPIPAGKVAVTLEMTETGRVGGFAKPGSHVAILMVPIISGQCTTTSPFQVEAGAGNDPAALDAYLDSIRSRTIERDVTVLGVGDRTVQQEEPAEGEAVADTVAVTLLTVAADQDQAEVLSALDKSDCVDLSFALRNDESAIQETGAGRNDDGGE